MTARETFAGTGEGFADLTWTVLDGQFSRVDGVGTADADGTAAHARCEHANAGPDMYTQVKIVDRAGDAGWVGVWVRMDDTDLTGYLLQVSDAEDDYILERYDDGVVTTLIPQTTVERGVDYQAVRDVDWLPGGVLRLDVEDVDGQAVLRGSWDGIPLFEFADPGTPLDGVRGGLSGLGLLVTNNVFWDDWETGDLAPVPSGLPAAYTLEIELEPGAWTDFAAHLDGPWTIRGGRPTGYEDTAPATLECRLRNEDGALTPDNPLSPHYPHLVEHIGIRATVTAPDGSVYPVFCGHITTLRPEWPNLHPASAVLVVTASDVLARINQCRLWSEWVEQTLLQVNTEGDDWVEVWPWSVDGDRLANAGAGAGTRHTAQLVPAKARVGTYSLDTVDAGDALLDGAITLAPLDYDAARTRRGWVVVMRCDHEPGKIQAWFRLDPELPLTTDAGASWNDPHLFTLYSAASGRVCAVQLASTGVSTGLVNGALASVGNISNPDDDGVNVRDGRWHLLTALVDWTPTNSWWQVDDGGWLYAAGVDLRGVRYIVAGGDLGEARAGTPTDCAPMQVGPVAVQQTPLSSGASRDWGDPATTMSAYWRTRWMLHYLRDRGIIPEFGWIHAANVGLGAVLTPTAGRTVGELLHEIARTNGGAIVPDASGQMTYWDGARARGPIPSMSLTVGEDDAQEPPAWMRGVYERPTRVTARSPAGDATVIDEAAEATGARREETIDTCAADAAAAAGWRMSMPAGLRLRRLVVDLVSSATSRWGLLGCLRPFVRVRVRNLPVAQLGITYTDVHVVGWEITLDVDQALVVLDTVPAGVEAWLDDCRVGADTCTLDQDIDEGDTTVVIATASGETLTTDSAAYPMDIDIDGERVRLETGPDGETTPQTFTGVTRGLAPSLARAHSAGETVTPRDELVVVI